MDMTNSPGQNESKFGIQTWPDGSAVAVVTWRDEHGEVYGQEIPDEHDALDLMRR